MSHSEVSTILLIDDHPMLRKGIRQLVDLEDDLDVVAEAGNGREGVQLALASEPDLILLDLNMDGMSGIDTLKALKQADVDARIIIFTVSDDNKDLVSALRAGADGYILKDSEPEQLLKYLRDAATGKMVLSNKLATILASALKEEKHSDNVNVNELTDRELQTLKLITTGDSNKYIARKLDITEATVKVHVKHLLKKLKLRSRVEAAVWAVERNIK